MSDFTTSEDATDIAIVTTSVDLYPVALGDWLAKQKSDYQAEVLMAFAMGLQSFGALKWRTQCAYIHDDIRRDKSSGPAAVQEVLRELIDDE